MRRGGRGGGGGVEGKVEGGGRGGVEGKGEEVSGGRAALTQQPRLASAPVAVCEGAESLHSENNRKISTQMTQLNSTVSVAVHCFFSVSFRPERVVVVMDSFGRIAAKQGRLTKGNILVFGGEGLSCSGGSWERKAAWGGASCSSGGSSLCGLAVQLSCCCCCQEEEASCPGFNTPVSS